MFPSIAPPFHLSYHGGVGLSDFRRSPHCELDTRFKRYFGPDLCNVSSGDLMMDQTNRARKLDDHSFRSHSGKQRTLAVQYEGRDPATTVVQAEILKL